MLELPILSGKEIARALEKMGYEKVRQRGSHMRFVFRGRRSITVPNYKSVSRGLLYKILRDAELSREDFLILLK